MTSADFKNIDPSSLVDLCLKEGIDMSNVRIEHSITVSDAVQGKKRANKVLVSAPDKLEIQKISAIVDAMG